MSTSTENPMADAVRDGIRAAIDAATAPSGNARRGLSRLAGLTEKEVEALVASTLTALADLPAPGPQVALTAEPMPAASPVLVLTPADVVAAAATAALAERDYDITSGLDVTYGNPEGFIIETFSPASGHVQGLRRLAWSVLNMFGVNVRSRESTNEFIACGPRAQVRAIRRSIDTLAAIGVPLTVGMSSDDIETFWRTVGAMIANTERGKMLAEAGKDQRTAANEYQTKMMGEGRIVPQNAAATEGALFTAASRVVSEQASRALA